MQFSARLLLLAATALCCFPTLFAFLATSPQCRCVNTSRSPMSSQHCKSLQIFPPTAHCRNTEILITLKNGNTVCVDPEVDWIKRIIEKVLKRSKRRAESPVQTKTSS
ncbi:C-X-C motif chemokine 13 [Astyanax mexicanus]|uniref:C-X-C motif chemokine 13 n=1 Tax=Astyanax mexicanus TaxID=7994 RepID=A0A8T2KSU1_ASTMX|nr:C-X-C motif chemokine 13 [Astyanax mexicanus]